jgi:urease accessory protein UreH
MKMTLDEAIRHCEEVAEQNETQVEKIGRQFIGSAMDKYATACRECAADHRQLAEWLMELKELKNSIGAVKLSNMKEALELIRAYKAENAALREFNDKIYDLLSDTFGCPCNFSPLDEYMMENGGCDDCSGAISDEECWRRYIQTKLIGGETDEHS